MPSGIVTASILLYFLAEKVLSMELLTLLLETSTILTLVQNAPRSCEALSAFQLASDAL